MELFLCSQECSSARKQRNYFWSIWFCFRIVWGRTELNTGCRIRPSSGTHTRTHIYGNWIWRQVCAIPMSELPVEIRNPRNFKCKRNSAEIKSTNTHPAPAITNFNPWTFCHTTHDTPSRRVLWQCCRLVLAVVVYNLDRNTRYPD